MKPHDDLCLNGNRSTIVNPRQAIPGKVAWLVLILSSIVLGASAQTIAWTDSFTQGVSPTQDQCNNWNNFRASLATKNFASVTISGTFDEVGKTLSDPVAVTELAQRLSSGTTGTVSFGGQSWTVGICGGAVCGGPSVTLSVNGSSTACSCSDTYAIKPGTIGNQWGGINTATCNGPSQTMRLVFHSGVSITADGPTTICPGGNVVLTANTEICSGPYTYLWSNRATTESITVTEAGSYTVTVTGLNGCSGVSSATAVSVSQISVDAGTAETFCTEPVQLNATGTSGSGSGGTVNSFCVFDAPGGAGGCAFPADEEVCLNALYYTSGSFSQTVSVANPVTIRYKVYYSAFSENTSFVLKLNNQQIGSFTENPFEATGACDTRDEGKFPRTFSFSASEFIQYWNQGADNILTVEVVSGLPGVFLAGISVEVVSANDSYSWAPVEGLSNPSISNPLASPATTTLYTVTYTDGNGCTATDQVEVAVNCNTAPVAVCSPVAVEAGANCSAMVEAVTFDGGSTSNSGGQLSFSVSPAGPYAVGETEVTLTVTDSNGESSSCTTKVTVTDTTPPTVVTPEDVIVGNDPGTCTATVMLTKPESSDNCGVESISNDHDGSVFPEGESIVTWTVTDIHGNQESTTQKVTVVNTTPVINSVVASEESVGINTPVTLTVTYTDNNVNGATVDWGDFSAVETVNDPETTFEVSHAYSSSGSYSVTITVTDECGKETYVYQSIMVIKNTIGSVKGGGWFDSPRGAYLRDPRAAGKATFAFSVGHTARTDVPVGTAIFNFREGKIKFRSTQIDWLAIDGQTATFQGTGKLNGKAGYQILISVVDGLNEEHDENVKTTTHERDNGKKKTDDIRVKIWDPSGSVIYDTQTGEPDGAIATTPLRAGSIQIKEQKSIFNDRFESAVATSFGEESTSAYPNPFNDWVDVQFNSPSRENVVIQMLDLAGKVVYNNVFPASEDGRYSLNIDDVVRPGIFIIIIKQGKRVEFLRLVRE